ncbi:MAG: Xaa-Pro peptidase family protein [Firmicutes bacterium]|nr:Xaa-Pro peptidase family protein [Bacillota bacterium]
MRVERIRRQLKETDVDAFLISSYENRRYVSGFSGSAGFVVISSDVSLLAVDGRYVIQAADESPDFGIVHYKHNPYDILKKYSFKRIYIEKEQVTMSQFDKLEKTLCDVEFLDGSPILSDMRKIKTPDEIAAIKKAADVADKAFLDLLQYIKPGLTERQVAAKLDYLMQANGAERPSFNTIVASSKRGALPHARPTDSKISKGSFVVMDFGAVVDGYCSDMTRTVAIGAASDEMREVYYTVLDAQNQAINAIKEGVKCFEVDKKARDVIEKKGFGQNFTHSLGHGVGLDLHEKPILSTKTEEVLQAGNVVTVEPGIYLEGKFGVRIEDLIAVTKQGYVNLTGASKELIEK